MKKTGRYSQAQRLAALTLALDVGTPNASRQLSIPAPTIYQWFQNAGGTLAIRSAASEAASHTLTNAEKATYDEIMRRMKNAPDSELWETFRAFIGKRLSLETAPPTTAVQVNVGAPLEDRLDGIVNVLATAGLLQEPPKAHDSEMDIVYPPSTNGQTASSPDP